MKIFRRKKPEEKQALHLKKGDVLFSPEGGKETILSVVDKNEMRDIHVTVRTDDGKRVRIFPWTQMISMYKKPEVAKWRYDTVFWLAKKLKAPIKRA
jgi:hypothetical protein